jgi:RND family efflux transporter MFP subunit
MKKQTIIISTVVVVILGAMVFKLMANKKEIDSRKEVKINNAKIGVTVASAAMRDINNNLEFVGTADADKSVVVASDVAGKVVQINFKLGDYVNKGTVLAKVDDTYKRLAYENAQINYDKFKEDLARYEVLRKGDAVSETQLRDMRVGFENAKIQLENAKKQYDDTRIVAPFSGVITSKNTELGAYLNVGNAVAGMADIAQLKVTLQVSESNVYELRKGQTVSVHADVYPDEVFNGTISNISPQGSSAHTYPVEIMIANSAKNPLKAGTYVKVDVNTGKTGKALMVPRDAIVSSVKDPSVYLVKGETVKLTRINTGRDYGTYLEVKSGLKEGDQVVTNGQINLTDGASVSVIKN